MPEDLLITTADIPTIVALMHRLPEFADPPSAEKLHARLDGVPHLIQVAFWQDTLAGFKVAYERDGELYSWLGGILPAFRRRGLARALADAQEDWARTQGYTAITFKTRNQHKAMLVFALLNGFDVIGFTEKETVATNRIILRKVL